MKIRGDFNVSFDETGGEFQLTHFLHTTHDWVHDLNHLHRGGVPDYEKAV